MNILDIAREDERYIELSLNLWPHEMAVIDKKLMLCTIDTYSEYLNLEQNKLIDRF